MENVFSHAFRNNVWGDPESVSGPGSGLHRTVVFRNEIPKLMAELGAHSLLDAGCGDFNWMKEVALEGHYIGVDIVADLIKQNRRYADSRRTFVHADITRDFLPQVDVILCRDCLVHFSFADVWVTLCNYKEPVALSSDDDLRRSRR